jgi:putative DNA primase/helicase
MDIPPREYALTPVIPLPGLVMLYAPRGMGKTFVSLSIALAIATGTAALKWQAPAPRRVLYIDGEMPAGAIKERLRDLILGAGTTGDAALLSFLCADLMPNGLPSLARPEVRDMIVAASDAFDVLFFDNLSTLASGLRENEADDWGELQAFFMALRRAGKSVVLIHHAGKGGQQRGTSRREDVLDTVINLKRPTDYSPRQGARFEVHIDKARGVTGDALAPFEASLAQGPDGGLTWGFADHADMMRDRVRAMLADGMSVRDIAEDVGMSKSAVHRMKQAMGQGGADAPG